MLIIVGTSNRGKDTAFFLISNIFLEIAERGPLVMECELCVYGQEKGETEMITRVLLRTQLGASLN